jgi:site-specific DNA-adenine methylase
VRPPIPWLDSKRRLAATILAALPPHTCYVEPFAGSASILFARDRPAKVEVLNDLDRELMSFFRVLKHHPEELERQFDWALNNRALFDGARGTDPETLTDVQRAARYDRPHTVFYLGPPYLGLAGYRGPRFTLEDYQDLRQDLGRLRGRAVLTVNDHPQLHRLFAGLPCEVLETRYRLSLQGHTRGRQLLIRSWKGVKP